MARGARSLIVVLVVLAALPGAGSADGQANLPVVCTATGPASLWEADGTMHWSLSLSGRCETAGDWLLVKAVGSGTSAACADGQLKNLHLGMSVTYEPVFFPEAVSGITATTRAEGWLAKTTPSAGLTPFLVTEGGKSVGAGQVGFRLTASCTAKTRLTFRWTRNMPLNVAPIKCDGSGIVAVGPSSYYRNYDWGLSGNAVCERGNDVWDVAFYGWGARSDDLGLCDPENLREGWLYGFSVQAVWTNRANGQTGVMGHYWNVLDQVVVPNSIRTLDALITTDPEDGCWASGGVYDARFLFYVLPLTESI